MKILAASMTCLLIGLACMAVVFLSGCATTSIRVTTPAGVKVTAKFPKNMEATGLRVSVGEYTLTADHLKTDAAVVIREKNVGVGKVAAAVSEVAQALTPAP